MALSIKDEQTDSIVRRYAQIHRTSYTRAINMAVSEALKREGHAEDLGARERRAQAFRAAVHEAQEAWAALPTLDPRDHAEMLYDEHGLPK